MAAPVGIFGLGLIGNALAGRLYAAGHPVMGHDPDPERALLLADAGGLAVVAGDVWSAPLILSAVFDSAQLGDLIAAAPAGTGSLLVSMSTCDPDDMAPLAARAAGKGLALVEACISGTSKQLAEGTATLLLGGEDAALDRLEPLLPTLAARHFRVGAIGNGNRAKLAINLVLGLNRAALAEGLVFAEALGLDAGAFLHVAQNSAAASDVMRQKGAAMTQRDFAPLGRIAQSHKDFSLIRAAAAGKGLGGLPFASTYLAMMEDCLAAGEGDLDNAAILNAVERAAQKMGR